MPSIYDIYEFYLEARDLKDKAHVVMVESAKVQSVFIPQNNKKDEKILLRFVNRRKGMLLNKTQAGAMEEIAGTDDYTKWVGLEIVLVAGRTRGKDTIVITNRANSGDLDLMYPPSSPRAKNIPVDFWNALSDKACTFAANRWGMSQAEAWKKLDAAVKAEEVAEFLPEEEFKGYVEMVAVLK